MSRMTSGELARLLARVRDAVGVIEGSASAMRESLDREVAEDHFSKRFYARFDTALVDVRAALEECFDAVDDLPQGVSLEGVE